MLCVFQDQCYGVVCLLFQEQLFIAVNADCVMYIAARMETNLCGHHTWQPLHFISNRQFSMFTSSLSAWETLMEESQGGNGVLSLQVTTAAWFNGTVCQKAEQQPVNQEAEWMCTHDALTSSSTRVKQKKKTPMKTDCQKLSPLSPSLYTHTHTHTQPIKSRITYVQKGSGKS